MVVGRDQLQCACTVSSTQRYGFQMLPTNCQLQEINCGRIYLLNRQRGKEASIWKLLLQHIQLAHTIGALLLLPSLISMRPDNCAANIN